MRLYIERGNRCDVRNEIRVKQSDLHVDYWLQVVGRLSRFGHSVSYETLFLLSFFSLGPSKFEL